MQTSGLPKEGGGSGMGIFVLKRFAAYGLKAESVLALNITFLSTLYKLPCLWLNTVAVIRKIKRFDNKNLPNR